MDDLDDEEVPMEDVSVKLDIPDEWDDFTNTAIGADTATLDDDLASEMTRVDSFFPKEFDFVNVDAFHTMLDYLPDNTKEAVSKDGELSSGSKPSLMDPLILSGNSYKGYNHHKYRQNPTSHTVSPDFNPTMTTIWNKLYAEHETPSEGVQPHQWFFKCNSKYTEYKTLARPLLPVGCM